MSSTLSAYPIAKSAAAPAPARKTTPALVRWIVPSFADVVFVVLMFILAFSPVGLQLFNDADTGWHIRNGEQILRTMSVPRVDSFSYTMAGRPWYAWEWLYDAGLGAIHRKTGLAGVRVLTAVVIALTFALLNRLLFKRTANGVISVALTVLAAAAAQAHMLARPHVLTWLFCVLFLTVLHRFQKGGRRQLLWLPVMMLLWVNIHSGFPLGLVLAGLFFAAEVWKTASARNVRVRANGMRNLRWLSAAGAACALGTLATPYGYQLHVHIFEYLRSSFVMSHNMEFQAPNFHEAAPRYFALLLLLTMAALAVGKRKLRAGEVLLTLFAACAGLYAVRNLPIAAILMTTAIAPVMASLVEDNALRRDIPEFVRKRVQALQEHSDRMSALQRELRGHVVAAAVLLIACAAASGGGRIAGHAVSTASFSERRFPIRATEKIASLGIHDRLFSIDKWGGYLVYRLYPSLKLFVDDRHDFYGEAFLREFLQAGHAEPGWKQILDRYGVEWALLPPDAPLTEALRQTSAWRVAYEDGTAVLFQRSSFQ